MPNPRDVVLEIRGNNRARTALEAARRQIGSLSLAASRLQGAFLGLAGGGVLGLLIKRHLEAAEAIGVTADRAGLGVERFQELSFAANQSDISTDAFGQGLIALNKNLGLFIQDGTGPAAKGFEALGLANDITTGKLRGAGPVFDAVVQRIGAVGSEAEQAAVLSQLFGRSLGPQLAPFLRQGTGGLEAFANEARNLGLVLSGDAVRGADEASDKLTKLGQVISIQFTRAVAEAAPQISAFVDALTRDPQQLRDTADAIAAIGIAAFTAAGKVATFVQQLGAGLGIKAAQIIDPNLVDELDQVEAAIARIENRTGNNLSGRGGGGEQALERLRARRAELVQALEDLQAFEDGFAPATPVAAPVTSPLLPLPPPRNAEADKLAAAIEARIDALRREADAYGLTRRQAELYELKHTEGVTPALLAAADAELGLIEIQQAHEQSLKDIADTAADAKDAEIEHSAALDEQAQALRDQLQPSRELVREIERLQTLLDSGRITVDEYRAALRALGTDTADVADATTELTDNQRALVNIGAQAGETIGQGFEQALLDGKKLKDVLKEIYEELLRVVFRQLIVQRLAQGIAGSIAGPVAAEQVSVQHAGGLAGEGPRRAVSPALFVAAPRLHRGGFAGLKHDEVPAILQRGEEVIRRDDPRHQANLRRAEPIRASDDRTASAPSPLLALQRATTQLATRLTAVADNPARLSARPTVLAALGAPTPRRLSSGDDFAAGATAGPVPSSAAAGGPAPGYTTQVTVINQTGQPARTERRQTPQGEDIRVLIGQAVASDIGANGPAARAMQGAFGLSRTIVRR